MTTQSTMQITKIQRLTHMYGHSYFGSGGASGHIYATPVGSVRCVGQRDNGFICSADGIEPVDAEMACEVYAIGGDCIGDEGREWAERYAWTPGSGWSEVHEWPRPEWAYKRQGTMISG